ncbi:MAG: bifunctional hydroxymethylpyrimidine kinase/phosphomethylpyrimidine kinase [Acidobacteriota bacterium]|nr:bifunctional hydroxymethylpyrimidine kinase/phosphomethylpyrimidine kinase [Acidobacteriota bacterium]
MNNSTSPAVCPSEPIILTIAGFDPTGGAGITADLKTFAAHNCYGVAAITALTVQNTRGVAAVYPVDGKSLRESAEALLDDGRVSAIKVGMIGSAEGAAVIRDILTRARALPSVLDPVLRSASGFELIDGAGISMLRGELLKLPTIITPNVDEASALTGLKVENPDEMKAAAKKLVEMGARAVVVTGGHLEKATDVFYDGAAFEIFMTDRIKPDNTHGTGCTFSSALAANLALGKQLRDAIVLAKVFVSEAIRKAFPIGPGRMPLHHLYRMQQAPRLADHSPAPSEAEVVH